jgi:hypothetical protein
VHEKSQEQVALTEHEECMDDGEKKRKSRDAIRLEVSEKLVRKLQKKKHSPVSITNI